MSDSGLSATDRRWLNRALDLAERGLYTTAPNPRVGCVICRDGKKLGEGWHQEAGRPHAERIALQAAGEAAGADIYLSLEPCAHHGKTPPCVDALLAAKPARVVVALRDPNPLVCGRGISRLREAGVEVVVAEEGDEIALRAHELNIGFVSRMTRHRPWLRCKIAATIDGRTALESGLSRWISNAESRRDAHHWRARSCALLTGFGTAACDNPRLTVRECQTSRQPLRVLIDSDGRASPDWALFADSHALWVTARPPTHSIAVPSLCLPNSQGKVDLEKLLSHLATLEINEVTVEAGAKLNGALLRLGLVDEVVLYLAPVLFGHEGRALFSFPSPLSPEQAPRFALHSVAAMGEGDIRVIYRRDESGKSH